MLETQLQVSYLLTGLDNLVHAIFEPFPRLDQVRPLLRKQALIERDKLKVTLWSRVSMSPLHNLVFCASLGHSLMDEGHVVGNVLLNFIFKIRNILEELLGDTDEGIEWPVGEVVIHCTVDESRELPSPNLEILPHRREAHDYVQVLPHLADEEIPAVVRAVHDASLLHLTANCIANVVPLLLGEDICNISGGKEIIHVNQEPLIHNLVVGNQECCRQGLHTRSVAQRQEELLRHQQGQRCLLVGQ